MRSIYRSAGPNCMWAEAFCQKAGPYASRLSLKYLGPSWLRGSAKVGVPTDAPSPTRQDETINPQSSPSRTHVATSCTEPYFSSTHGNNSCWQQIQNPRIFAVGDGYRSFRLFANIILLKDTNLQIPISHFSFQRETFLRLARQMQALENSPILPRCTKKRQRS